MQAKDPENEKVLEVVKRIASVTTELGAKVREEVADALAKVVEHTSGDEPLWFDTRQMHPPECTLCPLCGAECTAHIMDP